MTKRQPLTRDFWRVEIEHWGQEQDDRGSYTGYDIFYSGSSEPFSTKKDALKRAVQALEQGAWVCVEKWPGVSE